MAVCCSWQRTAISAVIVTGRNRKITERAHFNILEVKKLFSRVNLALVLAELYFLQLKAFPHKLIVRLSRLANKTT